MSFSPTRASLVCFLACSACACSASTPRATESASASAHGVYSAQSAPGTITEPPVPPADPRPAVVERIVRAALTHGRAYELLADLIHAAPKRLSGSEGADHAVRWAEARMRALGFENVHLEPCMVPHWERGATAKLEVMSPLDASSLSLPICALGGSSATPDVGIEAEVLRVTSFDELHAAAAQAHGRIVFFDRPMDASLPDPFAAYGGAVDQRSQGSIEAAKAGGVAAVVRSMTLARDDLPHTGAMHVDEHVSGVPAVALSTLGAERLENLLARDPHARLKLRLDARWLPDVASSSVVGEIVGREKQREIVLVGGHLDAWDLGEGAHDDGAGCAQTLEALRLLSDLGLRPRRTLRAVLFMNEENGLRGALAYRAAVHDELAQHVLALETDRGGFAPRGFETDATPAAFGRLRAIVELLEPWGAGRLVLGGGGADVGALKDGGVILSEFLPDPARYFDHHHAASDVLAAVHPRELELSAAMIASFLWCVADDPEEWPRNEPKKQP